MPKDDKDLFDDDKFFDDILKSDGTPEDEVDPKDADPDGSKAGDDKTNDEDDKSNKSTLEERLDALEKENKGLRKAVVENRQGKASFKGELDDLKQIIKEGMKSRGAKTDDNKDGDDTDNSMVDKLPLEFGEDGKGFVDVKPAVETLQETIQQKTKEIETLKESIEAEKAVENDRSARQQHINALIDERPGRDVAYKKLLVGLDILDKKTREILNDKGIKAERGINPGQALDMLEAEDGAMDAFNKLDLGVDAELVVRLFDSDRDFKKALDSYVDGQTKSKNDDAGDDAIMKNLQNKKTGPGSAASQGSASNESVVDRVGKYSSEDILEMDDATYEKLMARMEREARE
jgi:hypothetical protein